MSAAVSEGCAPGRRWTPFGKGAADAVIGPRRAALATRSVATAALADRRHQAIDGAMPPAERVEAVRARVPDALAEEWIALPRGGRGNPAATTRALPPGAT